MFYKPKHQKKKYKIYTNKIHDFLNFAFAEISWYTMWCVRLIVDIFHKFYQLGERFVEKGINFIDRYDEFWDKIDELKMEK